MESTKQSRIFALCFVTLILVTHSVSTGQLRAQDAVEEVTQRPPLEELNELSSFFESPLIAPNYVPTEPKPAQVTEIQNETFFADDQFAESGRLFQDTEAAQMALVQQSLNRWTFSIFGGWNFVGQQSRFGSSSYLGTDALTDGYTAGFATGRRIGPRLRSELEFSYRRHEVSNNYYFYGYDVGYISIFPGPSRFGRGEVHTYSSMANFYYDFDRTPNRRVTPYVGAGIGMSYIDTDVTYFGSGETTSNETTFAFQAMGGLSAKLGSRANLFVEYRFFKTAEDDFYLPDSAGPFSRYYSDRFEFSHEESSLLMGLRFEY